MIVSVSQQCHVVFARVREITKIELTQNIPDCSGDLLDSALASLYGDSLGFLCQDVAGDYRAVLTHEVIEYLETVEHPLRPLPLDYHIVTFSGNKSNVCDTRPLNGEPCGGRKSESWKHSLASYSHSRFRVKNNVGIYSWLKSIEYFDKLLIFSTHTIKVGLFFLSWNLFEITMRELEFIRACFNSYAR